MMTALFRTLLLYLFLIVGLRLMGKRQIGELETPELALALLVSDLAAIPMQDFGIPLLNGLVPIITLMSIAMLISYGNLKWLRFRKLLCGEPTLLIENGVLLQEAMRANRFTLDELLEELRTHGVSDIRTVKYAVLETSGQLSVLLYGGEQPITANDLQNGTVEKTFLPTVLVNDGRLLSRTLKACGKDTQWLHHTLQEQGYQSHRELFLMTLSANGEVFCLPKQDKKENQA